MAVQTIGARTTAAQNTYTTNSVRSKDGTNIGYHQFGQGAGVVLVQGTMGTAQHFMQLAGMLADSFTVYVPDRRGRGMSGAGNGDYTAQKDVEDLDALLTKTGAHHVFGLSSGAIITLKAALTLPAIRKAAIFEPPLFVNGLPTALLAHYKTAMAEGNTAAALVAAMKASQMGPAIFNKIPNWLLEAFVNMGMRSEDKKPAGIYPSMRSLAPTLKYDFQVVSEMSDQLESFRSIKTEILILGGSTSPAYLKTALDAVEKVLPNAKRIELAGVGHGAAWNSDQRGKPEVVAQALRTFFA